MKRAFFTLAVFSGICISFFSCGKTRHTLEVTGAVGDAENDIKMAVSQDTGTAYITELRWSTPEWEGFTNADGTGLYHDLINAIYKAEGIKIIISYKPWERAKADVKAGIADMTGADSRVELFEQPEIPITSNSEIVFFHKKTFSSFHGIEDLKNKKGIWASGYIENMPASIKANLVGMGNPSREGALLMVLSGRADYYLDNQEQLDKTLKLLDGRFDPDLYAQATIYTETLFMCFTKSVRGKRLAEMFDRGMLKLKVSGELDKIYKKWGYVIPPSVYWK